VFVQKLFFSPAVPLAYFTEHPPTAL
jgi:hypothetical protein